MTARRPTTIPELTGSDVGGINGDAATLAVERAVAELRRGRVVGVDDRRAGEAVLVAAVETLASDAWARLRGATGGAPLLAVTAERGLALGHQVEADSLCLALDGWRPLGALRALSGIGNDPPPACRVLAPRRAASAMVRLARRARLVPALVTLRLDALPADDSLVAISVAQAERYREVAGERLVVVSRARVPLRGEENCELVLFRDPHADREHLAILVGEVDFDRPVPARLHSACLTGDVLGSLRCDCGDQLRGAVRRMSEAGGGVLLYLAQEGRGIGLANKLRAYALQDAGLDTYDADQQLGFGPDERDFREAAAMLRALGIARIELLTNNPHKIDALLAAGIDVTGRQPLRGDSNRHNTRYLQAKVRRAGHLADDPGDSAAG